MCAGKHLGRVHAGMLQAARSILQEVRLLLCDAVAQHPTWRVVVCGHSLGGGVAGTPPLFLEVEKIKNKKYLTHLDAWQP
jgi:predicted lipase